MPKPRRALHVRNMHTAIHEAHTLRPGVRAKHAEAAARAVYDALTTTEYEAADREYAEMIEEAVEIDWRLVDRDRNAYDEDGHRFRFVNIGSIDIY